jgi:cardiolipin synthase A/B
MSWLDIVLIALIAGYLLLVLAALLMPRLRGRHASAGAWLLLISLVPLVVSLAYVLIGPEAISRAWLLSAMAGTSHLLLVLLAVFIIPVNRKPSSATAWLLLIALFPLFGALVFFLIGTPRLPPERRARQRKMDELVGEVVERVADQPELAPLYAPEPPPRFKPYADLNSHLGGMPPFAGNAVEVLPDYADTLRRIAVDIDAARWFVHVQFYILSRDDETEVVFAAMERAKQRGVIVRVLYDQIGSRKYPSRQSTDASLEAAGIPFRRILPIDPLRGKWSRPDLRNHRKLVVVDGVVGYTGSMNLIKRGYFRDDELYYDELVVRVTGPVVAQLAAVFVTDWYCETGDLIGADRRFEEQAPHPVAGTTICQVLPSGSGHEDENNLKLFTAMIHGAQRKLVIVNPYFVPDDALMLAICSAAQRGVDVTMINSEAPDQFMVFHAQRSFYDELLRCGVKIRLYKTPILLHSKFMTVDDDLSMVGSSNFDMRSFQLNLEISLVCYDPAVVAELRAVEAAYLARSIALTRDDWRGRSRRFKLFENLMRLTAALQ